MTVEELIKAEGKQVAKVVKEKHIRYMEEAVTKGVISREDADEIIEKIKLYLKKLTVDYELNGDKYIPIIIKSLIYENYKLAKNVLPDLGILLKNNFILGRIDIIKYKADLDNFLVKNIKMFTNENIINKKLNDLLIIILTHLDEIYKDEDIWIYLERNVRFIQINV